PTLPPSYALSSPLPRPPPPTLFPYTTLFRSGAVPVFAAKAQKHKSRRVAIYVQQAKLTGQQSRHIAAGCAADALLVVAGDDRQDLVPDRRQKVRASLKVLRRTQCLAVGVALTSDDGRIHEVPA